MIKCQIAGDNAPYFEWLIDKVGGEFWWGDYILPLFRLFERKYYYVNEIDASVSSYGKSLRTDAIVDGVSPISVPADAYEVSILEALVALAERVDTILMRSASGLRRPERWFDDFMTVLGFKDELGDIDIQIDKFLDGTNQIVRGKKFKPFSRTIWEQVNLFYLDQFDIETDEL